MLKKPFFIPKKSNIKIKLIDGVKIISEKKSNPLIINFKEDYISFNKNSIKITSRLDRVIDLKEFTYFELINKSKQYSKSNRVYLAEAHSRNVFSLTPIIFCMVFLSLFLRSQHSRYDNILKNLLLSVQFFDTNNIVLFEKYSN